MHLMMEKSSKTNCISVIKCTQKHDGTLAYMNEPAQSTSYTHSSPLLLLLTERHNIRFGEEQMFQIEFAQVVMIQSCSINQMWKMTLRLWVVSSILRVTVFYYIFIVFLPHHKVDFLILGEYLL